MALADHSYELYITQTCPYCRKVLLYLRRSGIELPIRDIGADPSARETLLSVGGRAQVPCLLIDGAAMYESDDIIAYLGREAAAAAPEAAPGERPEPDGGEVRSVR